MHHWTKFFGGILLVAGTTIGAAMLALPVSTGLAGLVPSIVLFFAFWLFMTYTALLFLEVNTWTGQRTNLLTMAKTTLGPPGEAICWTAYLFLLYALLTAYIAGSSAIIGNAATQVFALPPNGLLYSIPMIALFAYLIIRGTAYVDLLNRYLMIGLVGAYLAIIFLLSPYVEMDKLERTEWKFLLTSVSVVATSFGFHIIIPSLYSYLHADIRTMKWTLIIGSFIPLVVYIIWLLIALGIIPLYGAYGLREGYLAGANGASLLAQAVNSPILGIITNLFSFFAIVTSFIGVALSLCDFLADGLKIQRDFRGNLLLAGLTFLPSFAIAALHARAFLTALEVAGAYGVVFLLGLMPACMVWRGRYNQKRAGDYTAPGGRTALIAAILFSLGVIALEVFNSLGWLPHP